MKYNSIWIFVSIVGIIILIAASIINQDVIYSQLFLSLSLMTALNLMRLASGKSVNTNNQHEKKTGI